MANRHAVIRMFGHRKRKKPANQIRLLGPSSPFLAIGYPTATQLLLGIIAFRTVEVVIEDQCPLGLDHSINRLPSPSRAGKQG